MQADCTRWQKKCEFVTEARMAGHQDTNVISVTLDTQGEARVLKVNLANLDNANGQPHIIWSHAIPCSR